jgi:PIN domain nuclease of toxin-antitoxin system
MAGGGSMILDTCALLWLASGDKKLSRSVLKEINETPALYVSAISGFEIATKTGLGKLKLRAPPLEWFKKIAEQHGITILPLELSDCIAAAELPPIHNDPCDRFIIAIAKARDLRVVTTDERFAEYGLTVLG